jgi:hypothetical protein
MFEYSPVRPVFCNINEIRFRVWGGWEFPLQIGSLNISEIDIIYVA